MAGSTIVDIYVMRIIIWISAARDADLYQAGRARDTHCVFTTSTSLHLRSLNSVWVSSCFGRGILEASFDVLTQCTAGEGHRRASRWRGPSGPLRALSFFYCIVFPKPNRAGDFHQITMPPWWNTILISRHLQQGVAACLGNHLLKAWGTISMKPCHVRCDR